MTRFTALHPTQKRNTGETPYGAEDGIVSEGVAQVVDDMGNPLVFTAREF